jgi:hypothetical protein
MMADVFRRRTSQVKALPGYLFHGVTAVLALWFLMGGMACLNAAAKRRRAASQIPAAT